MKRLTKLFAITSALMAMMVIPVGAQPRGGSRGGSGGGNGSGSSGSRSSSSVSAPSLQYPPSVQSSRPSSSSVTSTSRSAQPSYSNSSQPTGRSYSSGSNGGQPTGRSYSGSSNSGQPSGRSYSGSSSQPTGSSYSQPSGRSYSGSGSAGQPTGRSYSGNANSNAGQPAGRSNSGNGSQPSINANVTPSVPGSGENGTRPNTYSGSIPRTGSNANGGAAVRNQQRANSGMMQNNGNGQPGNNSHYGEPGRVNMDRDMGRGGDRDFDRIPPRHRDPVDYYRASRFWDDGDHYFGYRVSYLPPRYSRYNYWGVDYYYYNDVYYRYLDGYYYVSRPPYGVYFNSLADDIVLYSSPSGDFVMLKMELSCREPASSLAL